MKRFTGRGVRKTWGKPKHRREFYKPAKNKFTIRRSYKRYRNAR